MVGILQREQEYRWWGTEEHSDASTLNAIAARWENTGGMSQITSRARKAAQQVGTLLSSLLLNPHLGSRLFTTLPFIIAGVKYARRWRSAGWGDSQPPCENATSGASENPLRTYFDSHSEGRGIWKWLHYFDTYHRHFSKFAGREVHVLEIGVYSGGSLGMWKDYFGPKSCVYGVDVEEACKVYEDEQIKISVGDQGDRGFWKRFKQQHPIIDVLIDDGSHNPEHQIITLEEMLPHLRHGGVYLCEDVFRERNVFHSYVCGLTAGLNSVVPFTRDRENEVSCTLTQFQSSIQSVHFYPFVTVIEKSGSPRTELISRRRGTEWQPFS